MHSKRYTCFRIGLVCLMAGLGYFAPVDVFGQVTDTSSIFDLPVQLDTFTLKSGFDVNAFIRRVRADTTFYKAFRSMRLVPYDAVNDIKVFGKHDDIVAAMHSTTRQEVKNHCRTTKVIAQNTTGDFYKRNGAYNYYTADLFAYLFFTDKPVCNENDIIAGSIIGQGSGGAMEQRKNELKQLIFNPGSKVSGVPFMGDRASIFDPGESEQYDFKVKVETYDGVPCYVFRITPKAGYEHRVLYNELTTWFRKSDYSIVARDYSLSYSTLVYDFNVLMKVRTKQAGDKLYPTRIAYDGNWHVFTKKRERVKFTIDVTY